MSIFEFFTMRLWFPNHVKLTVSIKKSNKMESLTPEERYQRIQQKEKELKQREEALRQASVDLDDTRPPNFPPFCPVVYHSISDDINIEYQSTVKVGFIGQFVWMAALVLNFMGACGVGTVDASGKDPYSLGQYIVFSILYAVLGIPLAFKINYMKLYEGCRIADLGMGYLALQAIFILINIYCLVGLKNSGAVGIISAIDIAAKTSSGFMKIFPFINIAAWGASTFMQLFLITKVLIIYKGMGGKLPVGPSASQA